MISKGIILAGGVGSRLYPLTQATCKQLLPVYDKPMVYYPLATLMLAGLREFLIISTPTDLTRFSELFGDGRQLGISIAYATQARPEGIAQALIIGENFTQNQSVALILGDNIFLGSIDFHQAAERFSKGATIFSCKVENPQRYGVLGFDPSGKVNGIEEKPIAPKSNQIVTGLYFYDNQAAGIAKGLRPSGRNELEISDVNSAYLEMGQLDVVALDHDYAWFDSGTYDSLLAASAYVAQHQKKLGRKFACIEEIALARGYIDMGQARVLADQMGNNDYRKYLTDVFGNYR